MSRESWLAFLILEPWRSPAISRGFPAMCPPPLPAENHIFLQEKCIFQQEKACFCRKLPFSLQETHFSTALSEGLRIMNGSLVLDDCGVDMLVQATFSMHMIGISGQYRKQLKAYQLALLQLLGLWSALLVFLSLVDVLDIFLAGIPRSVSLP